MSKCYIIYVVTNPYIQILNYQRGTMKKLTSIFSKTLAMTFGALLYAVAISLFLNPLALAPGGISGIAIIINKLTGLSTGLIIFVFNIPLLFFALVKFGRSFFFSTLYTIGVYSAITDLLSKLTDGQPVITQNPLLAAFAGGVLSAIGIGIAFRVGSSTGGADIIIKFLRHKYKHVNTGTIFFFFDMVVILMSAIAFQNIEVALYALIAVFVSSKTLDFVLYGLDRGKLVYIISDKGEKIAKRLLIEVDIGATFTEGVGAYSGTPKRILMCAIRNHAFPKMQEIVCEEDSSAFIIVSDTSKVIGEGHKSIYTEDL